MSVLGTIRERFAFDASAGWRGDDGSAGAFWCHDCAERIRDVEGPEPPSCPECEDEMEFERSVGTADCAC